MIEIVSSINQMLNRKQRLWIFAKMIIAFTPAADPSIISSLTHPKTPHPTATINPHMTHSTPSTFHFTPIELLPPVGAAVPDPTGALTTPPPPAPVGLAVVAPPPVALVPVGIAPPLAMEEVVVTGVGEGILEVLL